MTCQCGLAITGVTYSDQTWGGGGKREYTCACGLRAYAWDDTDAGIELAREAEDERVPTDDGAG